MLPLDSAALGMYRGLWAGGANEPGYGLSSTDLETIRTQLVGAPITIEHEGLMAAATEVSRALFWG